MKLPPKNASPRINTLLIDGNALFKFGFFGAKDEYNINGEHIGGLYQFLTIFRKMLVENLYHQAFVFWDGKMGGKLRYGIYPEYKISRNKDFENGTHPVDEEEVRQKNLIWEYLHKLSIRQIRHDIVESDDFIGYYCLTKGINEKITIVTTDRDMLQLISEDISIYFCDLRTYVTLENYNQFFKHNHENACLIKTICGDNSDNIKGIKGVKEKTLLSLIPELSDKKLTIDEVIEIAKERQEERKKQKKPPLKTLFNIINSVTDGSQKEKIYEINDQLVNLKRPLMTDDAISLFNELKNKTIVKEQIGIKSVLESMKTDGLEFTIGSTRYPDYLMPFKELIERELKKSSYE